jgi:signal peptidase I
MRYEPIVTKKEIFDYLHPSFWHEFKDYLYYFIKIFVLISVVVIFARSSVYDQIAIEGQSMFPNYNAIAGSIDKIYIDKLSPKFSSFKRGQVVVLIAPPGCRQKKTLYIKRIIGLPGEMVKFEKGNVYIVNEQYPDTGIILDEKEYLQPTVKTFKEATKQDPKAVFEKQLGPDEYFFMGDNRTGSQDARVCGPIKKDQILGQELFRDTPASKKGFFKLPIYNIGNQNQ